MANTSAPATGPAGRVGLGIGLFGLGFVALAGVAVVALARRRQPAVARSSRSPLG